MTSKEILKNSILLKMKIYLDQTALNILNDILVKELSKVDIVEMETLPATVDETNKYIIDLFNLEKAPKLSETTVGYYLFSINRLIYTVPKSLPKMSSMDIERYLNILMSTNDMISLNNHRRNISAFFTWMRKMHIIIENPCESIEPYKEITKPIEHLEPEEMEQLKNGCRHPRDRALIEFLRSTAMRSGEVPLVRICDIDWRSGKIVIFGKKSRKYRPVFLDSVAVKYLQQYILSRNLSFDSIESLFISQKSGQHNALGRSSISISIKSIGKRAKLEKNVYPHLFRKTTATNIVKRGGTEEDAGEYLGHASKGVTGKHYTYKSEDHIYNIFIKYVAAV